MTVLQASRLASQQEVARVAQAFAQGRLAGQRHREIAFSLQLSEAALLTYLALHSAQQDAPAAATAAAEPAAGVPAKGASSVLSGLSFGQLWAQPLQARWLQILQASADIGEVMALTRNEACVLESVQRFNFDPNTGKHCAVAAPWQAIVQRGAVRLAGDWTHWVYGFAVCEPTAQACRWHYSLQFFDDNGVAVHKVFLQDTSIEAQNAFVALVQRFTASVPAKLPTYNSTYRPAVAPNGYDSSVSGDLLRRLWLAQRDAASFEEMLTELGLARIHAYALMARTDAGLATEVGRESVLTLLQTVAKQQLPVVISLGNLGMRHCHQAVLNNIVQRGPWLNVLDPGLNLHLRQNLVVRAFVVHNTAVYGLCPALELFDAQGHCIVRFEKAPEPLRHSDAAWAQLIQNLQEDYAHENLSA